MPFAPDPKPRRGLVGPSLVFGADPALDEYFILNIPRTVGNRNIISMSRSTSGSHNADANPGGGSLHFEKDKWRKAKVNLSADNVVTVDLDGEEVFRQAATAPTGHYITTGYDEATGETVIKVVNATDKPYAPVINIEGGKVAKKGTVLTLSSASRSDENTMDNPEKIKPVESTFNGF